EDGGCRGSAAVGEERDERARIDVERGVHRAGAVPALEQTAPARAVDVHERDALEVQLGTRARKDRVRAQGRVQGVRVDQRDLGGLAIDAGDDDALTLVGGPRAERYDAAVDDRDALEVELVLLGAARLVEGPSPAGPGRQRDRGDV